MTTDPTASATPPQDQHGERDTLADKIAAEIEHTARMGGYWTLGGIVRETLKMAEAAGFTRQGSSGGGEASVPRYAMIACGSIPDVLPAPFGDWVKHEDHMRQVCALRARAEAAERERDAYKSRLLRDGKDHAKVAGQLADEFAKERAARVDTEAKLAKWEAEHAAQKEAK